MSPPLVVTGPAAYDAWEVWLDSDAPASTHEAWNEHRQHAEFIAAGHASAAIFLRRMLEAAPPELREGVQDAAQLCDLVVALLASSRDPGLVSSLFTRAEGRRELLDCVKAAEARDRLLTDVFHELAAALNVPSSAT
jgi:hypothetical protein